MKRFQTVTGNTPRYRYREQRQNPTPPRLRYVVEPEGTDSRLLVLSAKGSDCFKSRRAELTNLRGMA